MTADAATRSGTSETSIHDFFPDSWLPASAGRGGPVDLRSEEIEERQGRVRRIHIRGQPTFFRDLVTCLAENLRLRDKIDLTEGFIDASFTAAKKAALSSLLRSAAKATKIKAIVDRGGVADPAAY